MSSDCGIPHNFEHLGLKTPDFDLEALQRLVRLSAVDGQARVVEVGSWVGQTALAMLKTAGVRVKVHCVDTFLGSGGGDVTGVIAKEAGPHAVYETFRRNIRDYLGRGIDIYRGLSLEWAAKWAFQADMVFIDADHAY